jgi:hypothetical protein
MTLIEKEAPFNLNLTFFNDAHILGVFIKLNSLLNTCFLSFNTDCFLKSSI